MRQAPGLFLAAAIVVQMSGRILTPNGDGVNDRVVFDMAAGRAPAAATTVFDIRGRRVAELLPTSPTQLHWDGRDRAGRIVESGVYVVQIRDGGALWSGAVSVAK